MVVPLKASISVRGRIFLRQWIAFFSRECGGFEAALARMTSRQMRVALALAECPTGSIFAADFMERAGMTNAGAMKKAVDRFVKDRLVFLKDGVYRFSNPFFKEWIKDRLG